MKNVQIPYALFVALVEYHLGYDDEYEDEIRQRLEHLRHLISGPISFSEILIS